VTALATIGLVLLGALVALAVHDLVQRRHTILRNYPALGHFRYVLEAFGPELRQYIVTGDNEEGPFTRDERSWVYASSKGVENRVGFGTDNDLERSPSYLVIKHTVLPAPPGSGDGGTDPTVLACAKVLGGARGRPGAFRPASVVNLSAMSYGSLSGPAIMALNQGAAMAGCLHNTGEGGVSAHHRHGGELVWQIGTGYFGCRDDQGRFDLDRLVAALAGPSAPPVRAIEIKLSQGAKPTLGGLLPAAKVTPEIAAIRGVPVHRDCTSPPFHTAFGDVAGLIGFVESIAGATGLPVGIKSAVGQLGFWEELAARMAATGTGPDFVTIDGGEGGTGAAPLVFSDHVALPFKMGFAQVFRTFAAEGVTDDIVFIGSGKLGLPQHALVAMALGCDLVNVAREAMLAMGCLQARRCHTGRCPAGIATQSAWLAHGLDPAIKSVRVARYVGELRRELNRLAHAVGVSHPALVSLDHLDIVEERFTTTSARTVFGYEPGMGVPAAGSVVAEQRGQSASSP
jgi:glutamate synthase domain-containing protein 2